MINGLIPNRYAKALYKFAAESNNTEAVYNEMLRVIEAFRNNPDLQKTLANPHVETADKQKLLLAAAGSNPGEDYSRFVRLIIEHKREDFAYLMALAYRDLYRKDHNISQVKIITAAELGADEMAKLQGVVKKSFKDTTFEFSSEVNPDLIGGFIIDVDSSRMDASIAGQFANLRQSLLDS